MCLGVLSLQAGPFQTTLANNTPTKIVPETGAKGTPLSDTPATVSRGQLVRVANVTYFYTGSGGSFTAAQAEASPDFANILGNQPRPLTVVQNQGSTDIWLGFGKPAAKDRGVRLAPEQAVVFTEQHAQVAVYATSDGASGKVGGWW